MSQTQRTLLVGEQWMLDFNAIAKLGDAFVRLHLTVCAQQNVQPGGALFFEHWDRFCAKRGEQLLEIEHRALYAYIKTALRLDQPRPASPAPDEKQYDGTESEEQMSMEPVGAA